MKSRSSTISSASAVMSAAARVAAYDWQALEVELDTYGCAVLPKLLSPKECRTIAALYREESHFRSHIHMARHGFGKGEYRYFKYPLPDLVDALRTALYPHLAGVANLWNGRMRIEERIPATMRRSLKHVTTLARRAQHRCCCNMFQVTSIVSIRISMAISHSRSRSPFYSRNPARTSQVASLS